MLKAVCPSFTLFQANLLKINSYIHHSIFNQSGISEQASYNPPVQRGRSGKAKMNALTVAPSFCYTQIRKVKHTIPLVSNTSHS